MSTTKGSGQKEIKRAQGGGKKGVVVPKSSLTAELYMVVYKAREDGMTH